MYILPESNQSREAGRHTVPKADGRRWYFACPTCTAKWFADQRETLCPRCFTKVRSPERLTPPWLSVATSAPEQAQVHPSATSAPNLKQVEPIMPHRRPIHEIRIGTIRAAIWANENRPDEVWFAVTLSRLYKDGADWKDSTTFRRDDLPVVAKVMDMAYAWIWEQQTSESRVNDGP